MTANSKPTFASLPVGVMVPTRNCRGALPAHLAAMQEWLPQVEEVVVVDSHSSDGTLEFLKDNLQHPGARFLSHPPGLYESWNYGLGQIRSRFTYIATVGDAVPAATLGGLVEVAEAEGADVVLSPPDFVDERGKPLAKAWPIQAFLREGPGRRVRRISSWEWFAWAVMYLPGSLLGSSASNLYRTDYMRGQLFPLGFGHACDTAWAIENAFRARIVVAPELRSAFWVHPATRVQAREFYGQVVLKLVALARHVQSSQPENSLPERARGTLRNLLTWCLDATQEKMMSKLSYREVRVGWCPWFLQPAALRHRRRAQRCGKRVIALRKEIVSALACFSTQVSSI